MKVTNQVPMQPTVVDKTKESNPAAKTPQDASSVSVGKRTSGASVEISEHAQLMKQASEIARNTPDIRRDKVEMLKKSIQEGTYQIESSQIADRLVDEHLRNDFGKNLL
ncbi:MAG: flagellar biosynthesis anti-sigma factor FlgM [Pseudomonadota bacterium]